MKKRGKASHLYFRGRSDRGGTSHLLFNLKEKRGRGRGKGEKITRKRKGEGTCFSL